MGAKFLKAASQKPLPTNQTAPCERASENGSFSCVPFCLRSHQPFERSALKSFQIRVCYIKSKSASSEIFKYIAKEPSLLVGLKFEIASKNLFIVHKTLLES